MDFLAPPLRTPEGKPVANMYVHAAVVTVLASTAYSMFFNQQYLLGPFLIGIVIPEGPPLGSSLEVKYDALTMNVLTPISIAFSTMRCDVMKIIYEFDDITYNIFLTVFTGVLKMVSSMLPCLYYRIPLKEAISAGLLFVGFMLLYHCRSHCFLYKT
ncbi:Cation/H(+) antiporter 12 [Cardamine amara subsp. amara]|uniref:Cation/H(+) antiporter 12 n=1 Tax=Cardamine amara subsp. amara TaxID=228776 RepID=A0ABD1B7E1_CARAN